MAPEQIFAVKACLFMLLFHLISGIIAFIAIYMKLPDIAKRLDNIDEKIKLIEISSEEK